MEWFTGLVSSGAILAHIAALFYALGLFMRDQFILRALILCGTSFYIAYYYYVPSMPLWDAIGWSAALGAINAYVMIQILLERATFNMAGRDRDLYKRMNNLTPGEYRRLMKIATWHEGEEAQRLTAQNEFSDTLHYIVEGEVRLDKDGHRFALTNGGFMGEVSYLRNCPASATAVIAKDAKFVSFPHDKLAALEKKHPAIRVALRDFMNIDMAEKVASSVGTGKGASKDAAAPMPVRYA